MITCDFIKAVKISRPKLKYVGSYRNIKTTKFNNFRTKIVTYLGPSMTIKFYTKKNYLINDIC